MDEGDHMWVGLLLMGVGISLLFLSASIIASFLFVLPKCTAYEKTFSAGIENGEIIKGVFNSLKKEELFIDSAHGYQLHAMYFPVENSKKAVIIAHGIRWSLFGSYKYVKLFQSLDYNVLLCDLCCHGLSGGSHISYGYYEKDDLSTWVDVLEKKLDEGAVIGILGESLGAASAVQCIRQDSRIKFCIADSSFSDLAELCKFQIKSMTRLSIPLFIRMTSRLIKKRHGWGIEDVSPIKYLEKVKTPLLIFHGTKDKLIPAEMAEKLYEKAAGVKQLIMVEGADHVKGFSLQPELYYQSIKDFLNNHIENPC
jgi:dipeptidyl aminopeptidase/acylaminoacyl peptidase